MDKLYELLARFIDVISLSVYDRSTLKEKLNELSEYLHEKSEGRLPSKADIILH